MLERDTGRPRGFGFVTFANCKAMDNAIRQMHGRELGDRVISVNQAQPKMGGDDADRGYMGGYSSSGRGSYGVGDKSASQHECFKCGCVGHFARDCDNYPTGGSGPMAPDRCFKCGRIGCFVRECDDCPTTGGGSVSPDKCFKCGCVGHFARNCPSAGGTRGSNGGKLYSCSMYGGRFRDRDHYNDDLYDGGRYGDSRCFDIKDDRYGGGDKYVADRYPL